MMSKETKTPAILLFLFYFITGLTINSCKVLKKNFSYKLTLYGISNNVTKELPFKIHLISYNGYLLEFQVNKRNSDTLYLKSGNFIENIYYDTNGVYLLNPKSRRFIEFDTFSIDNKAIKSGKFSEKKFGLKLSDTSIQSASFFKGKNLKDTFLWNKNLYYINTLMKGSTGSDSACTHIFFMKDSNFTSTFELNSGVYPDPEYSMVGYNTYFFDQKIAIAGVLENMRYLTENERKICAGMINKMEGLNIK